jgi:hypothetical protein
VALVPAALGAAPASARTLALPLCSSDGQVRTAELPLEHPGTVPPPCSAKGCHGGASRKQPADKFEPPQ